MFTLWNVVRCLAILDNVLCKKKIYPYIHIHILYDKFTVNTIAGKYHYTGVTMSTIASQITGVSNVSVCCVIGLCEGYPPVTCGFPSQRASNKENVSIWWRQHVMFHCMCIYSTGIIHHIIFLQCNMDAAFPATVYISCDTEKVIRFARQPMLGILSYQVLLPVKRPWCRGYRVALAVFIPHICKQTFAISKVSVDLFILK